MGDEIATLRAEYRQMFVDIAKALSDLEKSFDATLEKTLISQNPGSVVEALNTSSCEEAVTSGASEPAEDSEPEETMNSEQRDSSELKALRLKLCSYQTMVMEARKHREKELADCTEQLLRERMEKSQLLIELERKDAELKNHREKSKQDEEARMDREKELADYAEQLAKERLEKSQLREELERKDADLKKQREETRKYLSFVDLYRESEVKCKRKDEENRALENENKQLQEELAEYEERIMDLESSVLNLEDMKRRSQLAVGMLQDRVYDLSKDNDELVDTVRCLSAEVTTCSGGCASSPGRQRTLHTSTPVPVVRSLWNEYESSGNESYPRSDSSLRSIFREY